MAFSFATPGAFGTSTSTPAFGQSTTPGSSFAFGGASTPAPAFGQAAATPSATPAFGSTTNFFGSTPQPQASQPQAQTQALALFQPQQQTPQQGSSLFGQTQPLQLGSAPFGQPQQQGAGQPFNLTTREGRPLQISNKWDEISEGSQQQLLQFEQGILKVRRDSEKLKSCQRLSDDSFSREERKAMGEQGQPLAEGFAVLRNEVEADINTAVAIREEVLQMCRDTETAIWCFKRASDWRKLSKESPLGGFEDLMRMPFVLPSQLLRSSASRFEETVKQYSRAIAEVEKVVAADSGRLAAAADEDAQQPAEALPTIMHNLHDYLFHVAAAVANRHERVQEAKREFLAERRQAGVLHNPFEEVERQELQERAKRLAQEAARMADDGGGAGASSSGHNPHQSSGSGQLALTFPGAGATPAASPAPLGAGASLFASTPAVGASSSGAAGSPFAAAGAFGGGGLFATPLGAAGQSTLAAPNSNGSRKNKAKK